MAKKIDNPQYIQRKGLSEKHLRKNAVMENTEKSKIWYMALKITKYLEILM